MCPISDDAVNDLNRKMGRVANKHGLGQLIRDAESVVSGEVALANTKILVGGVDGKAHEQNVSGDALLTNAGVLTTPGMAKLLGRAGGQFLNGGTAASEDLSLGSTTHATKRYVRVNDGSTILISDADPDWTTYFNALPGLGFFGWNIMSGWGAGADPTNDAGMFMAHISNDDGGGTFFAESFDYYSARGTPLAHTSLTAGDVLAAHQFFTTDGAGGILGSAAIKVTAVENFSSTKCGSVITFRTATVGTATAFNRLSIDSTGVFVHRGQVADNLTANVGGTTKFDLATYNNDGVGQTNAASHTVTAKTIGSQGDSLEFTAAGNFAATANVDKRIRVILGGTTLFDSGNLAVTSLQSWVLTASIIRVTQTSQRCLFRLTSSGATDVNITQFTTAPAEDLDTNLTLKLTLAGTSANDVTQNYYKETWQPYGA